MCLSHECGPGRVTLGCTFHASVPAGVLAIGWVTCVPFWDKQADQQGYRATGPPASGPPEATGGSYRLPRAAKCFQVSARVVLAMGPLAIVSLQPRSGSEGTQRSAGTRWRSTVVYPLAPNYSQPSTCRGLSPSQDPQPRWTMASGSKSWVVSIQRLKN